jgi:hypothetical protein
MRLERMGYVHGPRRLRAEFDAAGGVRSVFASGVHDRMRVGFVRAEFRQSLRVPGRVESPLVLGVRVRPAMVLE